MNFAPQFVDIFTRQSLFKLGAKNWIGVECCLRRDVLKRQLLVLTADVTDVEDKFGRKRYELPRPPGGYDRVLKRIGIQY